MNFRSAEPLRDAEFAAQFLPSEPDDAKTRALHGAEIDFAIAETARRHQSDAPTPTDPIRKYDDATAEATAASDLSLALWLMNQKARYLLYQKSDFTTPREILLSAAAMPVQDDPAAIAQTYKTLSSCEYFMGHLDAAIAAAERALQLYRETGDLYWQDVVLGNLVADYSESGRNEEATRVGREALTDAEQAQDTAGVVFCLTELASLYRLEGDPQSAFRAFREAEGWSEDIRYAPLIRANIEQALGTFYLDMGLWDEAERQLRLCLRLATPDSPGALEVRALLAQTLSQRGRGEIALTEYNAAIEDSGRLNLQPAETALRIERSEALLKVGQVEKAQADADQALQSANGLHNQTLRLAATMAVAATKAHACSRTHDCDDAEGVYRQAIVLMQQTSDREQEAIAYAAVARIQSQKGQNEAALKDIEHSLTLVEASRASLSSNILAASYFDGWRDWYALAESVASALDQAHPGTGYQEIAFRYSERERARAMLDAIGQTREDRAASASPQLEHAMALTEASIRNDQRLLLQSGSGEVAAALQHLYREEDQLAAATNSLQGKGPSSSGPIATISEVQRELLSADTALIAISPGPLRSYSWIITRDSVRIRTLPSQVELNRELAALRTMLLERTPQLAAGEDATRFAQQLKQFEKELDLQLGRAGTLLLSGLPRNIRRLYVVADGGLSALPWNALRVPCMSGTCYAVERLSIEVEPSASIAVALASRATDLRRTELLVVSDPVPELATELPARTPLGALPGSRRETRQIASLSPAGSFHLLAGADATSTKLRGTLSDRTAILHLATHTFLVPHHPELSGIVLSHESNSDASGVLWLHDVPSMHAPPLVTLSGCATEGSHLEQEDLNTLTQAFFYAGAQEVVASLWSVDDDSTATLMSGFYRNLLRRRSGTVASLRSAELSMIAAHASVFDWAAFTVNGMPGHTFATEASRR